MFVLISFLSDNVFSIPLTVVALVAALEKWRAFKYKNLNRTTWRKKMKQRSWKQHRNLASCTSSRFPVSFTYAEAEHYFCCKKKTDWNAIWTGLCAWQTRSNVSCIQTIHSGGGGQPNPPLFIVICLSKESTRIVLQDEFLSDAQPFCLRTF